LLARHKPLAPGALSSGRHSHRHGTIQRRGSHGAIRDKSVT
jgi:hypothetical protein